MNGNSDRPTGRVLVTGASGFLGQAIVHRLVDSGQLVRATDRPQTPPDLAMDYVAADILLGDQLDRAMRDVDVVVHTAGLAHVFDKSKGGDQFMAVNATGTRRVVEAGARAGVRRIVVVSSVSVYGGCAGRVCDESADCRPGTAYAHSKYAGECLAMEAAAEEGMDLTVLRLATLYGEGDPGNVARLLASLDKGRFVWIGQGENRKSLLYRDDAAAACVAAAMAPQGGRRIYNVSAQARPMRDIVEVMARGLDRMPRRWYLPRGVALAGSRLVAGLCLGRGPAASVHRMIRTWLADDDYPAERIRVDLAWQPQVALEEGLRREVQWYLRSARTTAVADQG